MAEAIKLTEQEFEDYKRGKYTGLAFPHPDYWMWCPECNCWHPCYKKQIDVDEYELQIRNAQ